MTRSDLKSVIEEALRFEVFDRGDTDQVIATIFAGVAKVLERDARFPRLTGTDLDLLFADVINEAHQLLRPYQVIDDEDAAEVIAEAVIDAMAEPDAGSDHKHSTQAVGQGAGAAVGE
jgi:hypothetical protein